MNMLIPKITKMKKEENACCLHMSKELWVELEEAKVVYGVSVHGA